MDNRNSGPTAADRSAQVKVIAAELGFDLCGIAPPGAGPAYERYRAQMRAGYGAEMGWLFERPELRRDVREVHPEANAVIVCAMSYADPGVAGYLEAPPREGHGWIARYAQGKDYHHYMKKALVALAKRLAEHPQLGHDSFAHRVFVDTGPVLEKAFAQAAGIGWIGKNTLLLNKHGGSWYFLGVVLTPLDLEFDSPGTDHCGTCRRCIDVCPTDALVAPYVLDARRCIANWTIESKVPADVIEPEGLGRHLFGCDLCQEICPHNSKATTTRHAPLRPRPENVRPALAPLEGLDEAAFKQRFPRSAVRRVKPEQMRQVIAAIEGT